MRVKCINNYDNWNETQNENITIGRVYDVVAFSPIEFRIIGNNGSQQIFVCDVYNNKFFEIIKEDEVRKEETRVIRKLEDLDGLENGMGAYLKFNKTAKSVDVHEFRTESFITSRSAYDEEHTFLSVIKSMGFKFEYTPTRTLSEVVEEMKLETDDMFEDGENYELYEVAFEKSDKHYKTRLAETVGAPVFIDAELAQKYADELNEIIGVK